MRLHTGAWAVAVAAALLVGCRQPSAQPAGDGAQSAGAIAVHQLRGTIVGTDPAHGRITVDHRAIPGFMPAMTMPYQLQQPGILSELHRGDEITADVEVRSSPDGTSEVRLDHVDVIAQSNPNHLPSVQFHVPTVGERVPDFKLLDQSGRHIELSQFAGKVLLMTFIYTRCPLPDYCVRMSENFRKINDLLAQDQALFGATHLLSVSFDPAYDTPAVLRSYGGAHTGRYTTETFKHWTFAAPSLAELPKMEQFFDVGVNGSDPSTLTHSLSTVLIGKDGKIIAWYPSNEWDPRAVADQMQRAARL